MRQPYCVIEVAFLPTETIVTDRATGDDYQPIWRQPGSFETIITLYQAFWVQINLIKYAIAFRCPQCRWNGRSSDTNDSTLSVRWQMVT